MMRVMKIITIITGLYIILYIVYCRIVLGYFPKSLSQSFIDLKKKFNRGWEFLLLICLSSTTLLLNAYHQWTLTDKFPILALGALGIFMVGVFAAINKKAIKVWHYIGVLSGFTICFISSD